MKNWHCIVILFILDMAFFWPCWLLKLPIMQGDNLHQNYPLKLLAFDLIKQGIFPFWNPYTFSGRPLFASIQQGILFPVNWTMLIFPNVFGLNLQIALSYFIASLGMYLYSLELTKNKFASIVASITFTFSGFMLFRMEHTNLIQAVGLIPFILFFLEKGKNSISNIHILLAAVFLGLQYLTGHPQISFLTLVLIIYYQFFYFILNLKSKDKYNYLINGIVIVILGTSIAAVQLLPTLQLTLESIRTDFSYRDFTNGSLIPIGIVSLFFPYLLGAICHNDLYFAGWLYEIDKLSIHCMYLGILPLMLSSIAIYNRKENKIVLLWLIIGLCGLILSFGGFLPGYKFFHSLPFYNMFRFPGRFYLYFVLAASVLSAIGIVNLKQLSKDQFIKFIQAFVFFTLIISEISYLLLSALNSSNNTLYIPYLSLNVLFPIIIIILSFTSLTILYLKNANWTKVLLISVLIIDVMIVFGQFTGWRRDNVYEYKYLKQVPIVASYLKRNLMTLERYMIYDYYFNFASMDLIKPNFSIQYKLHCVNGYDPLQLMRYSKLLELMIKREEKNNIVLITTNVDTWVNKILGVKYYVCPKNHFTKLNNKLANSPNWEQKFCYKNVCLYKSKNYFPKAWIVNDYKVFNNYSEVASFIKNPPKAWNPEYTALVEQKFFNKKDIKLKNSKNIYQIKVKEYKENEVILQVKNQKDGILVLNDIYYPTWKAYVDNKRQTIFPVDVILRGILLPKGQHIVKYKIEDDYFNLGLLVSIFTIIFILLMIQISKRH